MINTDELKSGDVIVCISIEQVVDLTKGKGYIVYESVNAGRLIICDDIGDTRLVESLRSIFTKKEVINSGGSSDYYKVSVKNPVSEGITFIGTKEVDIEDDYDFVQEPYMAECYDIAKALKLNIDEFNMFKEIWRTANERNDNGKPGNTPLRAAEKIMFFASQNLKSIKLENNDA